MKASRFMPLVDMGNEDEGFCPYQTLIEVRAALVAAGIDQALNVSPIDASGAILIAEAVNWAAKVVDHGFYSLKAAAILAASCIPGVLSGWGEDDAFYLWAEGCGTASFHDPWNELDNLSDSLGLPLSAWEHPWSGVTRQEQAFDLLVDARLRRKMARNTHPTLGHKVQCWFTEGPKGILP